ncbi:MAG: F0F1 ATP synthase subunit gamma [Thermodesulfobacteriota bacterium]
METVESLKRRIESTEDLQSVVKTMKALAAVKIRQFERAAESLEDYYRTVEMGLRAVFQGGHAGQVITRKGPGRVTGAVVFGSDQGMCGQLNDQMVGHAMNHLDGLRAGPDNRVVLAVGGRARARLEEWGQSVEATMALPGGVSGITPRVRDLLLKITTWQEELGVDRVFLFHSEPISGASYRPRTVDLLPLDEVWLAGLRETPWPTRALPFFRGDPQTLFSGLVREYLFVALFRGFAESLASENASRLASMQGAEKNIEERLEELQNRFHQQRQMSITEELLDIVSGFEALNQES